MTLQDHFSYLQAELAASLAAPLSRRKARLVAALADTYADRLFAEYGRGGDILEFRQELAASEPVLVPVFGLAADAGPKLVTEAVEVPIDDYGELSIEDFMVSLYNGNTVPRVRIAMPDGSRLPAHEVLGRAVAFLGAYRG